MGSLGDGLEKVKVGLPRSKTVSISRRLVINGESPSPNCPVPAEKMEALRCKAQGSKRKDLREIEKAMRMTICTTQPMAITQNTRNSPQISTDLKTQSTPNDMNIPQPINARKITMKTGY